MLRNLAVVESAGIAPYGEGPTQDAIEVMQQQYGVDISRHRPRDIADVSLSNFDCIIAMDAYVSDHLGASHQIPPSKLIAWDIEDPYLQGRRAYTRCASEIQARMRELSAMLMGKPMLGELGIPTRMTAEGADLSRAIDRLRADTARWKNELDSGILRRTLLQGIAGRATDEFEQLLRELLGYYLWVCHLNYDEVLRADMEEKALDRLTMGQVVQAFKAMNRRFTSRCRQLSQEASSRLERRRLLSGPVARQLDELTDLRNMLHHRPLEYAQDEPTLGKNAARTLTLIRNTLADFLFEAVSVLEPQENGG